MNEEEIWTIVNDQVVTFFGNRNMDIYKDAKLLCNLSPKIKKRGIVIRRKAKN